MSKSLRLSEKWFRRGLWLLSIVFAGFLIGLGGLVVNDLPRVEKTVTRDMYVDAARSQQLTLDRDTVQRKLDELTNRITTQQADVDVAKNEYEQARETYANWLASRSVTQQQSQNPDVVERAKALDTLKTREVELQRTLSELRQSQIKLSQDRDSISKQIDEMYSETAEVLSREQRKQQLRTFVYRLMVTLPLIVIAGWLFAKKRKGQYWPFVWGFIFFALYAFFVELVPYLPSYGGYVRFVVGIVVTFIAGHYGIKSMQRYLARQQAQEAAPDQQRRQELAYDMVLARLSKKVCPGCERPIDIENKEMNHCPHCGISIFNYCTGCKTRKNAFSPFCFSCGSAAKATQ